MGKIKTAAHAYTSGGILCPDIANTPETRRDIILSSGILAYMPLVLFITVCNVSRKRCLHGYSNTFRGTL